MGRLYTKEEGEFIRSFAKGRLKTEIQEEFFKRFGWEITMEQLTAYMKNHKITSGIDAKFKKGYIPPNKGVKGPWYPGAEKTWFKSGELPHNYRPVGSERICADGYIDIKVAEKKWRRKHIVNWEEHHKMKVPKGYCVIFLDGNKLNTDIENLMLISRKALIRMNWSGSFSEIPEVTRAAAAAAELKAAIGDAKRRRKNE